MTAFVVRRLLWSVAVLLVVVTIVFFMMRAIGGDPFRHGPLVGTSGQQGWVKYGDAKPESIQNNLLRRYALDLPWYRQYLNYLRGVATWNLGPSLSFRNRTVDEIVSETAPRSLELAVLAFVWAIAVGIPLGVFAALRAGTGADLAARTVVALGVAAPNFLVATVLIYVFAVRLGWLPTSGWGEGWANKVLPSFTLGLMPLAYCTRLVRSGMVEALEQDYVQAARAKGLRRARVVVRHTLPASLITLVTAAAPLFGILMTGSFIIENLFAVPGMARWYVTAVAARDYPVVMGMTVLAALVIVAANLLVDIVHGVLDPRVREAR